MYNNTDMERIGPYNVIGEVGRGGMGAVLRGVDPAIGRPVAIKVILLRDFSDLKDREMLRARLFREAQAAGILNHPGIVTVYYVGEEGDNAFIAMEFVNGPTLEKVLGAPQPPGKELLKRVFCQLAAALDYAHSKGIIHRDIKPANIMLDENGAVKICDFGIAKGLAGQTALTQAGTSLGSPFYMSPEQIQGGDLDPRADQYSLGVVAYEALTGKRPFQSDQIQSLFFHIMNDPPPLAHEVDPSLNPAVSEVLQKALAKDRAARYANCSEFVRALLAAWDLEPAPALPPEIDTVRTRQPSPPPSPSSGSRAKLWIGGLAAAAVLAAIGIGAFYWTRAGAHRTAIAQPKTAPPPQPAPSASSVPVPVPQPPRTAVAPAAMAIESFTVEPLEVKRGETAVLKWSVKHAAEVRIAPGIGLVGVSGTYSVTPASPTTYNLTAKAGNGSTKTASVTLPVTSALAIQDFSASPISIHSGEAAVLRWKVTGAERVSIEPKIGVVQSEGSHPVYPTEPTRYLLQATGPGGGLKRSVDIGVAYEGRQKIVRFWADPPAIEAGGTAVLRWEVINAAEVAIDHDIGRVDAQGVLKVSPSITTTYRLSATSKGTFHQDIEVKVKR